MNTVQFLESILSERNRSGQGVQRDLSSADIPAEIAILLQNGQKITK